MEDGGRRGGDAGAGVTGVKAAVEGVLVRGAAVMVRSTTEVRRVGRGRWGGLRVGSAQPLAAGGAVVAGGEVWPSQYRKLSRGTRGVMLAFVVAGVDALGLKAVGVLTAAAEDIVPGLLLDPGAELLGGGRGMPNAGGRGRETFGRGVVVAADAGPGRALTARNPCAGVITVSTRSGRR